MSITDEYSKRKDKKIKWQNQNLRYIKQTDNHCYINDLV